MDNHKKSWNHNTKTKRHNLEKTMFPCWRGVHVHKSASFKQSRETFQTNHKNDVSIDPKSSWNQLNEFQKRCRTVCKHTTQNATNFQIGAPVLEPAASQFPAVARYVCDLLFGTSEGYPLDRFGPYDFKHLVVFQLGVKFVMVVFEWSL